MNAHLNQDELIEQIYGAGDKNVHLPECAECSARFEALLRTKARLREAALREEALREEADFGSQGSSSFFAAQRRAVYARLDRAAASHVRWAPALAGAGLLAVGLLLFPHGQASAPMDKAPAVQSEMSADEQLFSDLYSREQTLEPSAEAPLHQLFDAGADGQ